MTAVATDTDTDTDTDTYTWPHMASHHAHVAGDAAATRHAGQRTTSMSGAAHDMAHT